MRRSAEMHEQPQELHVSFDNRNYVVETLRKGEAVNVLVSQAMEIVLSIDTHKEIKAGRGLEDDQILLEGLIEDQSGHIIIDPKYLFTTETGRTMIQDIENALDSTVEPLLRRGGKFPEWN